METKAHIILPHAINCTNIILKELKEIFLYQFRKAVAFAFGKLELCFKTFPRIRKLKVHRS